MAVSRALMSMAEYVAESEGEERAYAICVLLDLGAKDGTAEAEAFCAKVLAKHLVSTQAEVSAEVISSEKKEESAKARRFTVEFLLDLVSKFDPQADRLLLESIARQALAQAKIEKDEQVKRLLNSLLRLLKEHFCSVPRQHLLLFASTLATAIRLALAA